MLRRVDRTTSGERTSFPPANAKGARGITPHLETPHTSGEKDPQHTKRRHENPQLTYAFDMAVQAIRKMGRGRFFVLLQALEKRVGVPKAITAVAHRLSFTVYALWKKGALYEETEAKFYSAKRRRLAKRAAEPVEAPSLARAADNLIGQLNHTGATT